MFLEELENGDLDDICTEEDWYKIDHFLAFLVKKGILLNMPEEDKDILEQDVQELLGSSEGGIKHENTFYSFDNYSIIPCIYRGSREIILCKGWCSKGWKKTKKFVKKHKKEIIIGTVVVVATVAVVATVVIVSSATASSAAAKSHSSGSDSNLLHEESSTSCDQPTENITGDTILKMFDDQITDYTNIISENNLLSPESIEEDPYYQDNERVIGSILPHESLLNIPPTSYDGYDDILIQGHGIIDNAFSTDQVLSYLDNNHFSLLVFILVDQYFS